MAKEPCFICQKEADCENDAHRIYWFTCRRCGRYGVGDMAAMTLKGNPSLSVLSGVFREQTEKERQRPILTQENYKDWIAIAPPAFDVTTRSEKLLRHIARKSKHPGDFVAIQAVNDYPLAHAANFGELNFYIKLLMEQELLTEWTNSNEGREVFLTAKGWSQVQLPSRVDSLKVFVAMSFSPEMTPAYEEGIKPAIEACKFEPDRIDRREHNNRIDDEILAALRECRFVVADFTLHRAGVYFEAGFGLGLGVPVIWSCRKDELEKTHFDTRQFNHIDWTTPDELRKRLEQRIRATIGIAKA